MNNFTLIIPTHSRHGYLKRSLEYFKDLKADVIYCDSSSEPFDGKLHCNTKYLHLPGKSFASKILTALSRINTDFVALCADDDFIVIDSLYKGWAILHENSTYKTVLGKYISFKQHFDGQYYALYQELPRDVDFDVHSNAEVFFKNYYQILWAMYDIRVLKKAFNIISVAKFQNDNYIELVIGACACYEGAIKFLNEVWGVRETSTTEHWGSKHAPIVTMKIAQMDGDYAKFKRLIDSETTYGYADLVIQNYFKNNKVGILRRTMSTVLPVSIKNFINKKIQIPKSASRIELGVNDEKLLHSITLLLSKRS